MRFGSVCSGIEAASVAWGPLGWNAAWLSEIDPFASAVLAHHYPTTPNLGDMNLVLRLLRAGLIEAPGVLSTRDNAFGCFLAGLAGEDEPLVAPGGKWANAGAVYGPRRAVAWRVLDAQYFGVAQRRRRVFVVASARPGFDPAAVLFEFDGVRRDTAPRREAGEEAAATLDARAQGGGFPGTDGACGGHVQPVAYGGNNQSGPIDVATARNACSSASGRLQPAHTLRGEGFDASEDGAGRGTPLVPVAFDTTQVTSAANYSSPKPVDPCHPLAAGAHAPAIAFNWNAQPAQLPGPDRDTSINDGLTCSQQGAVAFAIQAGALRTNPESGPDGVGVQKELAYTLEARAEVQCAASVMQVRRLTPTECERLQGFPDGYTAIPWRGKPAEQCPDGPRYKALGNSWAVPNVRWIGARIQGALS